MQDGATALLIPSPEAASAVFANNITNDVTLQLAIRFSEAVENRVPGPMPRKKMPENKKQTVLPSNSIVHTAP